MGGAFNLAAPVLAVGTKAGTGISNTATATYEDPNSPGTTINTTSNTVTITVAEVAGITVTASGTSVGNDVNNDGKAQVGDTIFYNYTVTNVGNDPTKFRIPNLATVTGSGAVDGNLQVSYDGGANWTPISNTELITNSVEPGAFVMVRVPVKVSSGAASGSKITVKIGDTPSDGQNQLRNPNGGDVYTVDNDNGTPASEVNGAPINGVREASVTQEAPVDTSIKNYALAKILETRTGYNANGAGITDDTITYGLSLQVESTDPTGKGITPTPLVGTSITVSGTTDPNGTKYILISEAIPLDTELAVAPTPPPGWRVVYSTDDPTTTDANAASWSTSLPGGGLTAVKRVGFINDPSLITSITPGQTVSGFSVTVKPKSTATTPLTVNSIAQLFGATSANNTPVYDESGDQNPSNFDGNFGNMTPLTGTDTNNDGVPDTLNATIVNDGYVNDATDLTNTGTDTANNNSGTGSGGEANSFRIEAIVASSVLNGPSGAPDARGPNGDNDDFTNKSSLVPANTAPGSTLDPSAVAFTNTAQNNGSAPSSISLVPTPPTTAGDLPSGTTVTITYGSDSKTYTWNGSIFQINGGAIDLTSEYITIPNVAAGVSVNYGVEVNLPSGTPLSTDINRGFPVHITSFVDDATPGLGTETAKNTSIDRVYTGFLKLVKMSRVLQGTGPAVGAGQENFNSTPAFDPDGNGPLPATDPDSNTTDVARTPGPGNIIEYQISYINISTAQAGTGNVLLNASKTVITEDGTAGNNNWAKDNDTDGVIDTSNVTGTASDSGAATITFFSGNPATASAGDQTGTTVNTDVTKYVDTVTGNVAPGETRTFKFQRKVN